MLRLCQEADAETVRVVSSCGFLEGVLKFAVKVVGQRIAKSHRSSLSYFQGM